MKKLVKISLLLAIISTLFLNFSVFATSTRTNNVTNNSTSTSTNESEENTTQETNTTNKKTSTQVSSVSSANEGGLSISDILNILLIATGIVIVLLAIAILIRLK